MKNCLAVGNKSSGFYANHHPGGIDWLDNAAFRNSINFNMLCRTSDNATDVPGYGHQLQRNLSYGSRRDLVNIEEQRCELTDNVWGRSAGLVDADFTGLNEDELLAPRTFSGDLPTLKSFQRVTR